MSKFAVCSLMLRYFLHFFKQGYSLFKYLKYWFNFNAKKNFVQISLLLIIQRYRDIRGHDCVLFMKVKVKSMWITHISRKRKKNYFEFRFEYYIEDIKKW